MKTFLKKDVCFDLGKTKNERNQENRIRVKTLNCVLLLDVEHCQK